MNKQLAEVSLQRRRLLEKIAVQRMEVVEIVQHWRKPLALADAGVKAARFIQHHPAWVAAGLATLLAWRRKGLVGIAQKGWRLLYLYPAALTFGLKFISFATRSSGDEHSGEQRLAVAEQRDAGQSLPVNQHPKGE